MRQVCRAQHGHARIPRDRRRGSSTVRERPGAIRLLPHCSSNPSNARALKRRAQQVRVTHPFHPLAGRKFELIERRQNWADDRVYVLTRKQETLRLPVSWTSLAPEDPFVSVADGRAHFRLDDLRALRTLVDTLLAGGGHGKERKKRGP